MRPFRACTWISILAAVMGIVAIVAAQEVSTPTTLSNVSPKTRLFSLFDSGEGLILICIGVSKTSNVTWYWRRYGSDMVVPIPSKEDDLQIRKSYYWMIFRNELKAASRLEVHGLSSEYNNTNFVCSSNENHEEYMFTYREPAKKIAAALPTDTATQVKQVHSFGRRTQARTWPKDIAEGSTRSPNVHLLHQDATTHPTHNRYPHIYYSSAHNYEGGSLYLECTYTSRNSPVMWNLEYSFNHRDIFLPTKDTHMSSDGKIFFSIMVIPILKLLHNNTKVVCENEEGKAEYFISLGHKKQLHQECDEDVDCLDTNTMCRYNFCSCKLGYFSEFTNGVGTCMKLRKYKEKCTHNNQCRNLDDKMRCDGVRGCRCALGYYYNGKKCQAKKRNLGDQCYINDNCAFTYGVCQNTSVISKECTCLDGFVPDGFRCLSQQRQNEEHMFRVGFLTAVVVLVVLTTALIVYALKSARYWYMHRKRNHYREVIMGEHQLSISSRVAKYSPTKADVVTREKIDSPNGPIEMTFTNIQLTPPVERRELKKPAEDKTVCVPETIPFMNMEHDSSTC